MRTSQVVLEIDLAKIRRNYQILSKICTTSKVGAAVKANAYGLGASEIAAVLRLEGCEDFFVANIEEGARLRGSLKDNANIYILNGIFNDDIPAFIEYKLIPVLNHLEQFKIWQEYAIKIKKILPCTIHVNTGINRLGMDIKEAMQLSLKADMATSLDIKYIMSHLSASEQADNHYNNFQLKIFKDCLMNFKGVKASLANSGGIFLNSEYHFDLVRAGIALYGGNPTPKMPNPMNNVVRLLAPIIQLQKLPPKSMIGYNMTFVTNRDTMLATLPVGYADGYSRHFSSKGHVFVDGHSAPVVGRVSMDLVTVDVTDLPQEKIYLGQQVEIIGDYCTIDKIAAITGTISYEILTQLGNRYKRIYK
jgi:alanine racemase